MSILKGIRAKVKRFKKIFEDNWLNFTLLHPRYRTDYYNAEINKMLDCGTDSGGFAVYKCLKCGKGNHKINFSCKSKACPQCGKRYSRESMEKIASKMFLIVTVPVLLGIIFRKLFTNASTLFEPIAKKISIVLFVLVLLGAILAERENIISYFAQAGLITLILNVVMMVIAYYIAKIFGSGEKQKRTITIECGLQNGTLAIVVATSIFGGGIFLIPAATYSLIMFVTSLLFVYFVRKNN